MIKLIKYKTATLIVTALISTILTSRAQSITPESKLLSEMYFRNIGPSVAGGRVHDVVSLSNDPSTIYLATASGGLWKTTNRGTTWKPISDNIGVSTFGDLVISPSNPNIIWAGTGEQNNRQSTSWGNGIYRSEDAGETWTHKGLTETRHIGRVLVDPKNPDIAYVAALGNLWKSNEERGVFKTSDGGNTWEKILYIDAYTGVVDIVMDPKNSKILYAATYQRLRRTWGMNGGGPGSGIYKSTDGGNTWKELTKGLPEGDKGRIGLSISESNPKVIYALIQHEEEGGTYRTENKGKTWKKVNKLNPRPMYYSHINVDPLDENRVYVLGTEFYMSADGGKVFRQMPTRSNYDVGIHSDFHSIWIDPNNTKHFYLAGDAGIHETWDRGETYRHINNLPIAQFYAIGVDMDVPYRIYGGMQDNHSWVGPSETRRWIGIINDDWKQIGFGDGMYQQPDPDNYRYVYTVKQQGGITRLDAETGDKLDLKPYPPEGEKPYRFDWTTPALISSHDSKTVYLGGNRLFITHDRGLSWDRTEDLSRQVNRDSLMMMGVQGKDIKISKNDGTASYGEITTIAESKLDQMVLWVGTDDGNLQVSKDGAKHWIEVSKNIHDLPEGTYVSRVITSKKTKGTAYATFDAHRDGDWAPYVYQTSDYGKSWKKITKGLPKDGSAIVIVEHPDNSDLLLLGTEHALFVSFNAGQKWSKFESNLPPTLYDDIVIHPREKDIVLGTHGRSIWILDDCTPLAEWNANIKNSDAHLFEISPATIFQYWKTTSYRSQEAFNGANPPSGAIISYYLNTAVDSVQIVVKNDKGEVVRKLKDVGTAGIIHRVHWDLKHKEPPFSIRRNEKAGLIITENELPKLPRTTTPKGPFVSPGDYTVTLIAGVKKVSKTLTVNADPELNISLEEYKVREKFLLVVLDLQNKIWDYRKKTGSILKDIEDEINSGNKKEELKAELDKLKNLNKQIGRLMNQINSLSEDINGDGVVQGSLYPPTKTHRMRKDQIIKNFNVKKEELKKFLEE